MTGNMVEGLRTAIVESARFNDEPQPMEGPHIYAQQTTEGCLGRLGTLINIPLLSA